MRQISRSSILEATISSYEKLANEYDSSSHETTRILERLSLRAFRFATTNLLSFRELKNILEIGCGTGKLTEAIINRSSDGTKIDLVDSSRSMLKIARRRLNTYKSEVKLQYHCISILDDSFREKIDKKYDAVFCGLADPYFTNAALQNISHCCKPSSKLFVTLPTKQWAIAERKYRLKIPSYLTRFTLSNGLHLLMFSATYSRTELVELAKLNGVIFRNVTTFKSTSVPHKGFEKLRTPEIVAIVGEFR